MAIASRSERGAAAVEFAIIALLMVMLLFGILEGGRLFLAQSSLSAAARETARELAIHRDDADPEGVAIAAFAYGAPKIVAAETTECSGIVVPESDDPAVAVLEFDLELMTGLFWDSVTLRAEGVMRCSG